MAVFMTYQSICKYNSLNIVRFYL